MAGKTPGTRKGASPKKATKQKSAITPIDQGNPTVSQGNAAGSDENKSSSQVSANPLSASHLVATNQGHSAANEGSHGISVVNNGNKAENSGTRPTEGLVEQIRIRAYELFEERGRLEGYHQEDWARAEAEILAKFEREKSA